MSVQEKPPKRRKAAPKAPKPSVNSPVPQEGAGQIYQELARINRKLDTLVASQKDTRYISASEYATHMPYSYGTLIKYLNKGEIPGAFEQHGMWHLPWPPITETP